ncbi:MULTISPECIES: hypothetical protein [unclassified Brevundimonas]|uniref:hypothetical protein n=1 Tax=unclassified Brevundimonas TaxID=2622653 RepID=UPI0025C31964|nr:MULTISPECIES: hypothetical protein [unclassified Brevundimonas]
MIILPGADRISERRDPKPSQKYANLREPCKQLMLPPSYGLHKGGIFATATPDRGLKALIMFALQQKQPALTGGAIAAKSCKLIWKALHRPDVWERRR